MSISAQMNDREEVGEYTKSVWIVRNNKRNLADDVLADTIGIANSIIQSIRLVITNHPDWNDKDVAEEVLDMEAEEELKAMVESDDDDEDVTK